MTVADIQKVVGQPLDKIFGRSRSVKLFGHDDFLHPFHLNSGNLLIAEVFLVPVGHAVGYVPISRQPSPVGPRLGVPVKAAANTPVAEGGVHQKLGAVSEVL